MACLPGSGGKWHVLTGELTRDLAVNHEKFNGDHLTPGVVNVNMRTAGQKAVQCALNPCPQIQSCLAGVNWHSDILMHASL